MNNFFTSLNRQQQLTGINQQQYQLLKLLVPFLLSSALCCFLIVVRVMRTDTFRYSFLIWNLFLAWMPLLFAYFLYRKPLPKGFLGMPSVIVSHKEKFSFLLFFGLWLIFFPNAPYLISDLVHLRHNQGTILWFDAAAFFCFAATGLQVGLLSLFLVEKTIAQITSKPVAWLVISGSIWLSGLGVYIGRELRFNSWDLVTDPIQLFQGIAQELTIHAISMTLLYATLIGVIYLIFRSLITTKID